ncbi:glycoside hydrolase family 43 protein [Mongoliitalea lutea]|nr:glycoside hydrolase family 43 protein [Mongoliitalea lutea]
MKNYRICWLLITCMLFSFGHSFAQRNAQKNPIFKYATYEGKDQVYIDNPLGPDEFYNPILQGCYPDPAITRKGDDYFMVVSSFVMFPGVPIFHSKDLVNWTQIGHVLDRKSQLKVSEAPIALGIFAPDIKYNPYNDTFYMITTQFAGDFGNIVVKTKDPFQGWSDPIKLKFDGIDPGMFFDDNGKAYVVHNDAPDPGKERYDGHRVIKIWEYDLENDQVIEGTDKIIVDGGVDPSKNPIWIEAPHIYKKNDAYYLMCAEGGTGGNHSEVIFKSDHPMGPYIPAPSNPILTQRYFGNRSNRVDWAGHADLVLGPDDKYYGVFLGIRPNEKNRVNTGRETFILPVDWSGEWPVFENGLVPIQPKLKMPGGVTENKTGQDGFFPNGNFTYTERFDGDKLDFRWIGLRGPREDFLKMTKNGAEITPFAVNMKEMKPTSTLFYRQQHKNFSFTTELDYKPNSEKDLAGIACVQSESFHYVFGVTKVGNDHVLLLERTEAEGRGRSRSVKSQVLASVKVDLSKPIFLQVKATGDDFEFAYSLNGSDFSTLGGVVSGDILSTNVAGGFTGNMIGLYATSANDISVK